MNGCNKTLKAGDTIAVYSDGQTLCWSCSNKLKGIPIKEGALNQTAIDKLGGVTCGQKVPLSKKAREHADSKGT